MDENNELQELRNMENSANEILQNTCDIIDKSQSIRELATQVTKSFENMYMANLQINGKLEALRIMSDKNTAKFKELVKGAEKRLDQEMNMIDKLTESLISYNLSSCNEADIRAQESIMNLIQNYSEKFNNELEKLYLL